MPLDQIREERIKKLEQLKSNGVDPYPATVLMSQNRVHISDARNMSDQDVVVAGRLRSLRPHGKIAFADLEDESGKMQLFFSQDALEGERNEGLSFKQLSLLDIGDFIQAQGQVFTTQAGEITVKVSSCQLLTKTLLPLPSDWYGLKDMEERLRKRYLDLLMNPDVKEMFRKKTVFWNVMRQFLIDKGFLQVDMPILESIPGGADARPFVTHHNALDIDLYLRISLELPLKRLLVGGFEKVFEIGHVFRNEGIDAEHLQDYTAMEFYWAYADYNDLMNLLQDMYQKVIQETFGSLKTNWEGHEIDWSGDWPRVDYTDLLNKEWSVDIDQMTVEDLYALAKKYNVTVEPNLGKGRLLDYIYKKTIRPNLIQPMFVLNHPVEVEPLAKRILGREDKVQRTQILAMGSELGKGFSELNDPLDQRERFLDQMKLREAGDDEAQMMDEDFVEALEYGMPPAAGFGVSERLFSMLVDKPIREVVFFPTMKPEGKVSHGADALLRKQDFDKKFVVVLNRNMSSWQLTNTVGHIGAFLGNKLDVPFDTGKHFETKDGKLLPRNSQYAVVTLSADEKQLHELIEKARENGLSYIGYVPEMIEFIDDKKLGDALSAKNEKDVEYCGVGIFGSKKELDELTRGLELYK